jgi:PAS domain S-box-containing protein
VGNSLAAESLLSLAVTVTSEQRVESVLQSIVQGLASQPGVALARIWLLPSADLPSFYNSVSAPPDYLCLVASAGTPIASPGEDWCFLRGHFARVPFNVGKVGQVAASRRPILLEDVAAQNDWVVRPEWAKREEIRSFAGHPLIFRDKLLGVIAVFSRQPFGQQQFTWLGLFANQAAVAIANACAEKALQSSERNLAAIINTIPTTAWTTRSDGYCDFLNQGWLDYTGMTAKQAEGWGWAEAIHPDDRKRLIEEWQSCLASGTPIDTEARIRRFDAVYRWFLIRGNPLRDGSGNILKWYGTCVDIEDRKRAEEALRQSEERARLMVDSIDGQIMTATAKGEVEFVNQQVLDYFGKSLEELKDWRTNDAIHPDDFPRALELWAHSVETGDPYQFDERLRRSDGAYRWFRVRGRCLHDAHRHIVRWYVLLTDIDEGKRAEAQVEQAYLRLAEAQRLSKTGSFITDLVADDHNWSEETFRIFDFDPTSKITVQRIRDLIQPEDLPSFDAMIARAMTGADVDFVFRILTSRGAVKHIRGMARVMTQLGGHPLFIGALQDVTESKVAEEALDKARSELAHVARATTLNALTASIAHEINQPLASLVTNASICLRRLNVDPPNVDGARETVERTIRDANRASDVIVRLRALFSKKEFALETLDLNEITTEVIALVSSDLQRNRVILRSELAKDLPPIVGDRVQLQQVTLNLIRNASDAMVGVEDRQRELLVKTQREEDRVRLSVQDAGCGINPEDFKKLFEAFYTTKSGGMGIGLSVSRSIIERHQGRLWAEPNDGPGTTFVFSIPQGPNRRTMGLHNELVNGHRGGASHRRLG